MARVDPSRAAFAARWVLTRWGAALVAPRAALAIADDPAEAGRAGTDLFLLLCLMLVAAHTRELFASGWLAWVIDWQVGGRAMIDVFARAVTQPLAGLIVLALGIFAAAGRKRSPGRDFDLACVAIVPLVVIEIVASLLVRGFELDVPDALRWIWTGAGYAWALGIAVLAVQHVRAPAARKGQGTLVGGGIVAVAALLLGLQTAWIVSHLDWLRPMASGDRVPSFALPRVVDNDGHLGESVSDVDLRGRPFVIDFWATWCGPCLKALPFLSDLAARGDVTVLAVNIDDAGLAHQLFDEEHYQQVLVEDADHAADRFGVSAIPHLVVVDPDGVVRMVARGDGQLDQVIDLAEQLSKH